MSLVKSLRSDLRQERNDCLVAVHTSIEYGHINFIEKFGAANCSSKEITGVLKKMMMKNHGIAYEQILAWRT